MNVILSGLKEKTKDFLYRIIENNLSWKWNWPEDCVFCLKVFVSDKKEKAEIIMFSKDHVQREKQINKLYIEYLGSEYSVLTEIWVKPVKGSPYCESCLFIN